MVIDAKDHTASVIISRLRAEARRTITPREITVLSRSVQIAACALAWAQMMGYLAGPLGEGDASFRIRLTPSAQLATV